MNTEVVRWDEELARQAKEVAALERPSLSNISLRSGVMMLNGMQVPGNKLQCVIIASAFQNRFYKDRFDANNPSSPVCFSLSPTGVDMVPHADSVDVQSESCEDCPQYKWGSDPLGGRGKACKATRRLALLPASALAGGLDNAVKQAEMAVLTVPVTSGKNWANYVNSIAVEFQRPPWGMLTEITVQPNPETQFEVKFQAAGIVKDDTTLGELHKRIPAAEVILLTPYDATGNSEEKADDGKQRKF